MEQQNSFKFFSAEDPGNLPLAKKKIKELKIFNPENYFDDFIVRRIESRMLSLKVKTYTEYLKILESSEEEHHKLKDQFTINVTHFFRDFSAYGLLKDKVLPEIIERKTKTSDRSINIWSAGCSSGEEPYSIAILLSELLGVKKNSFRIKIRATDIDPNIVRIAKCGIYEERQLRETPSEYVKKYFESLGDGHYKIKDEIKSMVEFTEGDILEFHGNWVEDIIICRNTVIYFRAETKEKLYMEFYKRLNPKGFLILGKTETLTGPAKELFSMYNLIERVYIKPEQQR